MTFVGTTLAMALVCMVALASPALHAESLSNAAVIQGKAAGTPSKHEAPLLVLGPGDVVTVHVFGRPELTTTTYVTDAGNITIPLAGVVKVGGQSPQEAAQSVAKALRQGQYLVNPQVTITLAEFRSQRASVLGEVRSPGRFPIESKTTVFDLLAEAGGITENGADTIYLLRPDSKGDIERYPINLEGLDSGKRAIPMITLKGGDSIYVPRADQFYIYGEVRSPDMYRLEPGMTVVQAISRGGGITERGSDSRIDIRRKLPDGKYKTMHAKLSDRVRPDDVILVKEAIF